LLAGNVCHTLGGGVPGVIPLGPVDDLQPLYSQARLVVNLAVAGTGLKIKTLEALCHLRPIVTWPNGIDGLATDLAARCEVAYDWYDSSRRVIRLLASEDPTSSSQADRDTIVRLTSPASAYQPMTDAFKRFLERHRVSEAAGMTIGE